MRQPGVDVVIPNYNYGRYLGICVRSVLSQDIENLRVLIIDNASTDDSADVARALAAEDARVELLLRPVNKGQHASFNDGIDWASGDYFVLLCSDDFIVPGALRRALAIMETDPTIAFSYGRDVAVNGDAPIPPIPPQPDDVPCHVETGTAFIERFCRLGVFQLPGSAMVVRTAAQKAAGHYVEALPHSDDYHMWLRLGLQGRIAELDCVQGGTRSHGQNRSQQLRDTHLLHIQHTADAGEYFFAREGRVLPDCDALHRMARRGIAERAYWSAISHLLRGDPAWRQLLKFAVSQRTQTAFIPPVNYLLHRPDTKRRLRSYVDTMLARPLAATGRQ